MPHCRNCGREGPLPAAARCACRGLDPSNAHLTMSSEWRAPRAEPHGGGYWHPDTDWVRWPNKHWGLLDWGQAPPHPGLVDLKRVKVVPTQHAPGFNPVPDTPVMVPVQVGATVVLTKPGPGAGVFSNGASEAYFTGGAYMRCTDGTAHGCSARCPREFVQQGCQIEAPKKAHSTTRLRDAQSNGERRSRTMRKQLADASKRTAPLRTQLVETMSPRPGCAWNGKAWCPNVTPNFRG